MGPGSNRAGIGGRGGRTPPLAQKVRQSMAATRHRSTARRFVRSACRFMSVDRRDGQADVSPACRILRRDRPQCGMRRVRTPVRHRFRRGVSIVTAALRT
ncbi:hypothetical protein SBD_1973 [Streptomyces bottropensis ATCC 25435]|uniref:Uncharacterized protein n=1 Tax=Streptomyces bottropensis ATCC 25435 TaxID=1054862 RepID=M3FWR2_9ACTN|nr:hypothetical protein SBD_1973 [Streptomyces bottropensis ATCC 25435]